MVVGVQCLHAVCLFCPLNPGTSTSVGEAAVHDKQALVLVNNGNATGNDIVHLATEIQKSVYDTFSIRLQPEVIYIPS